ncbi:MAG: hypothetical protein LUD78_04650 [Clostridiales bacterium]|nr:hypothetical protein [Clostridiales bacterium]
MNEFAKMMRRVRLYSSAIKENYNREETEAKKREKMKGSAQYDEEMATIRENVEKNRVRLFKEARDDLQKILDEMRANVEARVTKAPSTDMVNALNLLGMLDSVSPGQLRAFGNQMASCPLALEVLQQIAHRHNMAVYVTDPDEMFHAIDVLEGNLASYLQSYNGDVDHLSAVAKNLYQYFQPNDAYVDMAKSIDSVNDAFWKNIICFGSPDMLESPDSYKTETVEVKLFFEDVDGLMKYINKQTENMEGAEREDKVMEILRNCPNDYGTAYRYYIATGGKGKSLMNRQYS